MNKYKITGIIYIHIGMREREREREREGGGGQGGSFSHCVSVNGKTEGKGQKHVEAENQKLNRSNEG